MIWLLPLFAAAAALVFPLPVYAASLALFGLPHVLAELRYVDLRFVPGSRSLPLFLALGLVLVLAGLRGWPLLGLGQTGATARYEIALIALLSLGTALFTKGTPKLIGVAVGMGVLFGASLNIAATLVVIAFLHNLTPVLFLAERLEGAARTRAMRAAAWAFLVIPLLMAGVASAVTIESTLVIVLGGVGDLRAHLGSYIPPGLVDRDWAVTFFAIAAYLQVMHYAVVLHVLPKLVPSEEPQALVPWPSRGRRILLLGLASAPLTVAFCLDFASARATYAVFAAVHVWIEVPALLGAWKSRGSPGLVTSAAGAPS